MRRLAVFIVTMTYALPAFGEWETYKPKDDQFTILFPGHPQEQSQETAFGATVYTARYKSDDGLAFVVMYGETGIKGIPNDSEKASFFKGVRTNAQGKGSLLSETDVTFGGHPGKEFFVKMDDKGFMRMQMYLVNTRMYGLTLASLQEADLKSEGANEFLTSFAFPQGVPPILPATPATSQPVPPRKSLSEVIGGALGTIFMVLILIKLFRKKAPDVKDEAT